MQKNLYYRTVFKRTNAIKEAMLSFFMALSSYPRLLLEVFIRRNFGERYFSFSGSIFLALLLGLYPLLKIGGLSLLRPSYGYYGSSFSFGNFMLHYASWYGFLLAFLVMAVRRNEEVKRLPSVFDFARFSLSSGRLHPRFLEFKIGDRRLGLRTIETLLEPAFFFLIGLVLWMFGQGIGLVLILCSIIYSLSYQAAYYQGDQFIMDKIDEMICNEELVKSFVEERDPSQTRGFNFYGRRPVNPETRRKVAETFLETEETVIAL
ncbi:hypothetical protein [Larkinella rosea]|uniref:Uncharacterized protein n=1 Tax=Larkinella rosea TaxID=2025312 RepID=A0A3P1BCY5_9BACT|nr:hypothetical protein [Larkinella rosea]RRA98642.1 hypothetical protein EHT25_26950 [Larkinella rosea]